MSGICGIIFKKGSHPSDLSGIQGMCGTLRIHLNGKILYRVLGDLALGGYSSKGSLTGLKDIPGPEGKSLAIVFHGTLLNTEDLGGKLWRDEGNVMKTLLDLYFNEGIQFLKKLRGEFVLALWDGRQDKLYLASDRFRIHPLFYYSDKNKFIFASRMRVILDCPYAVETTIDSRAIIDVVGSSYISTPKSIFNEVKKLPPGHVLTYQEGKMTLEKYWDINFLNSSRQSARSLSNELKIRFQEALEVQLRADTPRYHIGAFLSGGVDSSTVVGLLTRLMGNNISTFSIGFHEERFNELRYARIVSEVFKTKHHEYYVSAKEAYESIPVLIESFDEPYANASSIPTYFCAKVAREHGIDILYSGDGGDELFAGNERYATQRLFEYYDKIPMSLRDYLINPVFRRLEEFLKVKIIIYANKYIRRASIPYPNRLTSYDILNTIGMVELFDDSFLETIDKDYKPDHGVYQYYHEAPAREELDRQLYIDLKLAISDNDLFKVTRMSKAAGVTVRFPFLDHQFAEFSATIPADIKMRGRQLRTFFKQSFSELLPREVLTKTKHGFGLPISVWLKSDPQFKDMMLDLVLSPKSIQRGYFKRKAITAIVNCHKHDNTSLYGTLLWNLMILELWHRRYIDEGLAT